MKIYIIGIGGVGGYLGGRLAKTNNNITFVARGNYQAIKKEGLKIKSLSGSFKIKPVQVIKKISEIKNPDLIIFTVKTYDTKNVAKKLATIVNKNSQIITFQNGIDNDLEIKKYIKNISIYPGIIYTVSKKTKPNLIEQTETPQKFVKELIFGDRDKPYNSKLENIQKIFKKAGIDSKISKNIIKDLWFKYIFISAFSGMTTVCNSTIGKILDNPFTKSTYEKCIKETIKIAKAMKVNIPQNTFKIIMTISNKTNPKSKSSLLADITNKRKNEIETLNGKIVKLAKEKNINVPINEFIYGIIKLL